MALLLVLSQISPNSKHYLVMAIISTKNTNVIAVQNAYAEGSEFDASALIVVGIVTTLIITAMIVLTVIAYNAQALREGRIRDGAAADVIKRIIFAILFFVVVLTIIGVFYAF